MANRRARLCARALTQSHVGILQRVSACAAHTDALEQLQERALAQDKALGVARDHIAQLSAAIRERDDIIAGGSRSVRSLPSVTQLTSGSPMLSPAAHDPAMAAQLVSLPGPCALVQCCAVRSPNALRCDGVVRLREG